MNPFSHWSSLSLPQPRRPRISRLAVTLLFCHLAGAAASDAASHLPRLLHRPYLPPASAAPIPSIPSTWPTGFQPKESQDLRGSLDQIRARLETLRQDPSISQDAFAEAALYFKGAVWALRFETNLAPADASLIRRAIELAQLRASAPIHPPNEVSTTPGFQTHAYVSVVDGSVQPFGVLIPQSYSPSKPIRLDVVLHGSSRPSGLSELRFLSRFDSREAQSKPAPEADYIELHPLGRVENCYRWAGETDVFEAIEAVCRRYAIDRARIVLRGMSMGASGTWHLGLKHPDEFVALGPYCGYVDTHRFSETPVPGFIRVGHLPPHQERSLTMLDSILYAANVGIVPTIAAIGDQDVFYQAHVLMAQAIAAEGLDMNQIISSGTGHVIDPATHREQLRRIALHADAGRNPFPKTLRFVTHTLKYSRCHWLEILAQQIPYARSELAGRIRAEGTPEVEAPVNVTRFALHAPAVGPASSSITIDGQTIELGHRSSREAEQPRVFTVLSGKWRLDSSTRQFGASPGLQGPIDDAFTAPFVCVRGTGRAWNPAAAAHSTRILQQFQHEWAKYMRGDLPVIEDTQVTETEVKSKNLILFGDPGSNLWIRKVLPQLPLRWTQSEVRMEEQVWTASEHLPRLVVRNPLKGGSQNYLVLNSGHTFGEREFAAFNYLLFPRMGDWSIEQIPKMISSESSPEAMIVRAGFLGK